MAVSIGKKLVENFNLLLQHKPSEECSQCVNEQMLSFPDKHTFHRVMMYLLDIVDNNWRSKCNGIFVTKKDERLFNNIICENLKSLRNEFPEVKLPLLTPSGMICFHGEKARETLWKITNAVMLVIMKKETNTMEENEDLFRELQAATEEKTKLWNELEQRKKEIEKVLSAEKDVLSLIISSGNWNEDIKKKSCNINSRSIIADLCKKKEISLNELNLLKDDVLPYLEHIQHTHHKVKCQCLPKYVLADEIASQICELLWENNQNYVKSVIETLKCASAIKKLRKERGQDISSNNEQIECINELVVELENLVYNYQEPTMGMNFDLGISPLPVNLCSSEIAQTPPGIASFLAQKRMIQNRKEAQIPAIKIDAESVMEYLAPIKVGIYPTFSIASPVFASTSAIKRPAEEESIMSVLRRMRSKATPRMLSKAKPNPSCDMRNSLLLSSSTSSVSAFVAKEKVPGLRGTSERENFTPISKEQRYGVTQSTSRRQSMGFYKPPDRMARRQLNEFSLRPETISHSVGRNKATSARTLIGRDRIIDEMVKEMVEGNSFSSNNSDFSLSGVEHIISPPDVNKLEPKQDSDVNKMVTEKRNRELDVPDLLSELIADDMEIANSFKNLKDSSFIEDEEIVTHWDVLLDEEKREEIFKPINSSQQQTETVNEVGRNSLVSLIERYNAIKNACA